MAGGECPGQHQQACQHRDDAGAADRQDELVDEVVDRLQRVLHPHGGHRGEGLGRVAHHLRLQLRVRSVGQGQGREIGMRRAAEGARGEHHDEVDAERAPLDLAQVGDPRSDRAAEHVDRDRAADLQPQGAGQFDIEGDERLARLLRVPPRAFDDARTVGRGFGVGDAPVAIEDPGGVLRRLDLSGGHAVQRRDPAAHHRHPLDLGVGRVRPEEGGEAVGFARGHVEEEQARGAAGQGAFEGTGDVAVDGAQRHQQGRAEAEREHHGRRQRAGAVEVGQRHARHHALRPRQARGPGHQPRRDEAQGPEGEGGGGHEDQRHLAVEGGEEREARKREQGGGEHREVAPARPARGRIHGIAEQPRDGDVVGAPQRQDREGQCRQQAVGGREREAGRGDLGVERQRKLVAERDVEQERQGRADGEAERGADRGDQHHLDQVEPDDLRTRRADALEGRDRALLAIHEGAHGIRHADPADDEGGEADEREELGEALDPLGEARIGVVARAHLEPRLGQGLLHRGVDGGQARVVGLRHLQAVGEAVEAARLDQAGGAQGGQRDQQARTEADAGADPVGLRDEGGADLDRKAAERHPVAGFETESGQQGRVGHGAVDAVPLGDEILHRALRVGLDRADRRIARIDRLQLDQGRAAIARHRHGAQARDLRDRRLPIEHGALGRRRLAVDQAVGDVAAQDPPPLAPEPAGERGGDRGDAADRRDAERDAGDEHPESGEPAAQFAQGESEGERQPGLMGRPGRRGIRPGQRTVHARSIRIGAVRPAWINLGADRTHATARAVA